MHRIRSSPTATAATCSIANNGGYVYGGYRVSRGTFPVYEDQNYTNRLGEVKVGALFSLLRDRLVDERRTRRTLASGDIAQAVEAASTKSCSSKGSGAPRRHRSVTTIFLSYSPLGPGLNDIGFGEVDRSNSTYRPASIGGCTPR